MTHPSSSAEIRPASAEGISEITASDTDLDRSFKARTQVRALSLTGGPIQDDAGAMKHKFSVVLLLPVGAEDCKALARTIGGGCGKRSRPLRRGYHEVFVQWERNALLSVAVADMTQMTLAQQNASAWSLRLGAARTRLRFSCVDRGSFSVTVPGSGGRGLTRCAGDKITFLRIRTTFLSVRPPSLALLQFNDLRMRLHAQHADVRADNAVVDIQDDLTRIRSPTILNLRAASNGPLTLQLDVGQRRSVTLHSSATTSLRVANNELLPSAFTRYLDYWLVAIALVISSLAAAWRDKLFPAK